MKYILGIMLGILGFLFLFELIEIKSVNALYGTFCFTIAWLCIGSDVK